MNVGPVASDDLLQITQDTSAEIGYLVLNDTDADGDALSILSTTTPANGSLIDNGDGSYTYTPTGGYAGDDSFDYVVSDGKGGQDTGTIDISVNIPIDGEAARDQILAGVTSLVDPTQPGHMVVYGPTAFSITNYPGSDISKPMISAASMGQGKVVVMPDHQWLILSYGSDPSMAAFYQNSIAWLGDSTSKDIKVVTYHQGDADWLIAEGFTDVVNATTASLATDLVGADVFVAGWMGSNPADTTLNTVGDYVKDGGGLFIADYGIGYDWWWGKAAHDIPSNKLLRDAGIAVTMNWPASGAQAINRGVGQMTSDDVIGILQDSSSTSQEDKDIAAGIYDKLNGVLADDDSLQAQLDEAFWARIDTINPTPSSKVSDSLEKTLLKREMNLTSSLPADEVTAHRTAEAVYGAISPGAPRLSNHSVSINASMTGWQATGMYAAPGELVTVTVPASMAGQGYSVRINGHVDNISSHGDWARVPYGVSRSYSIDSTTVQVAAAFGGAIYIDMGGQAGGTSSGLGAVSITLDGAVEAPFFALGQTTDTDWINTIRDNPAPYAELVNDHVAFSIPSSWIRDLDNPTQLMTYWDDLVAYQDWVGGFENVRTGQDRINIDVAISVGWLHAGYPIQGPTAVGPKMVDYDAQVASGEWGWYHELGHEMQRQTALGWGWDNYWTFPGDVEVTCNIFAQAATEEMVPGTDDPLGQMEAAIIEVNDPTRPTFDQKNAYVFYHQLADGHWGYGGFRNTFSTYVDDALNNPGNLPSGGTEEKDQWLTRWSQQNGYDMTEYMVDYWKLEVSQAALDAVAAMALPGWMPLATTLTSPAVAEDTPETFDVANAGMGLDGVATLISVGTVSNGALVDNGDGTYTYTPNPDYYGPDAFDVTYQSSAGNQQTLTVKIDVFAVNDAPVANDDTASTAKDNSVVISVLANDSDVEGDSLYLTAVGQGASGAVADNGDGTVTYTPDPGFAGDDQFTYTVSDGLVDSTGLLVHYKFDEGSGSVIGDSSGNGYDATPSASPQWDTGGASGSALNFDADYLLTVPAAALSGLDQQITVSLWVFGDVNQPLSDSVFSATNASGNRVLNAHVPWSNSNVYWDAGDSGSSYDRIYKTAAPSSFEQRWNHWTFTKDAAAGTMEIYLNGGLFHSGSGKTLNMDAVTSFVIAGYTSGAYLYDGKLDDFRVYDRVLSPAEIADLAKPIASDTATVYVTVTGNTPPVANDDTAVVNEDESVVVDVLANDTDADPGDTLTVTDVTQGTDGAVVDNGDGTVTYTPDVGFIGSDSFTYTISDGNGGFDTATVYVTVGVDSADLVAEYTFEDDAATDTSPHGADNSGTLAGDAAVVTDPIRGKALSLDGDGDYMAVPDSADINMSTVTDRTISLLFNADSTSGRQVIYEEGGKTRGINIYIDNGLLYVGIWGMGGASEVFLSTAVTAGGWNHVALVLDDAANSFSAFLNGEGFGSGSAGTLNKHSGDIGIGRVAGKTRFHDGTSARGVAYNFAGLLDSLLIYNRVLNSGEIDLLSRAITE